jgi:uncharacterized OB-fold protein
VAVREDLLSTPLTDLDAVRLMGSRCSSCGETTLGRNTTCPNCGKSTMTSLPLSRRGRVWTYTVVRHKPPGDYRGPEPFVPFAMGLVELPEGLRVLAPLDCDVERLRIEQEVELRAFVRPGATQPEVVSFTFVPVA